jgi:hypothetical protein
MRLAFRHHAQPRGRAPRPLRPEPLRDPAELDRALIAELARLGDLAEPRDTRFFLSFADAGDAERAAGVVEEAGFGWALEERDGDEPWRLVAWRDMVVDEASVADARRLLGRVAVAHWGSLGGWEAQVTL